MIARNRRLPQKQSISTMMPQHMLHLGHARVAALNLGTIAADLAEWLGVPCAEWGVSTPLFARPQPVPVQAALISVPGAAILVDACDPADLATLEPPPGYRPPPGLADQLAALGLHPADITHVVVTHLHADHYNGLVRAEGGAYAALCPNARHLVGRADWLAAQAAIADPATLAHRALAPIARAGLLELVDGARDLGGGVSVLPAPGETPGHQIVRLRAGGQSLFCLGDLYHHPLEVERPEWLVSWADPAATRASRAALLPEILAGDALVLATHIAGFGRLRQAGARLRWVPA